MPKNVVKKRKPLQFRHFRVLVVLFCFFDTTSHCAAFFVTIYCFKKLGLFSFGGVFVSRFLMFCISSGWDEMCNSGCTRAFMTGTMMFSDYPFFKMTPFKKQLVLFHVMSDIEVVVMAFVPLIVRNDIDQNLKENFAIGVGAALMTKILFFSFLCVRHHSRSSADEHRRKGAMKHQRNMYHGEAERPGIVPEMQSAEGSGERLIDQLAIAYQPGSAGSDEYEERVRQRLENTNPRAPHSYAGNPRRLVDGYNYNPHQKQKQWDELIGKIRKKQHEERMQQARAAADMKWNQHPNNLVRDPLHGGDIIEIEMRDFGMRNVNPHSLRRQGSARQPHSSPRPQSRRQSPRAKPARQPSPERHPPQAAPSREPDPFGEPDDGEASYPRNSTPPNSPVDLQSQNCEGEQGNNVQDDNLLKIREWQERIAQQRMENERRIAGLREKFGQDGEPDPTQIQPVFNSRGEITTHPLHKPTSRKIRQRMLSASLQESKSIPPSAATTSTPSAAPPVHPHPNQLHQMSHSWKRDRNPAIAIVPTNYSTESESDNSDLYSTISSTSTTKELRVVNDLEIFRKERLFPKRTTTNSTTSSSASFIPSRSPSLKPMKTPPRNSGVSVSQKESNTKKHQHGPIIRQNSSTEKSSRRLTQAKHSRHHEEIPPNVEISESKIRRSQNNEPAIDPQPRPSGSSKEQYLDPNFHNFSLEHLTDLDNTVKNIDTHIRELYLNHEEFQAVFGMTKQEYSKLSTEKKNELKHNVCLDF